MKVYQAINAVQAELAAEGIAKTRENKDQHYKFRGVDDVFNAVSSLHAKHQLVVVPHYSDRTVTERQTKSGGMLFNVVVTGRYEFLSVEDGSKQEVGPFYGEAMDSADKATNKAMSQAYKMALIQTYSIPTEGDNDADATTHEVAAKLPGDLIADLKASMQEAATLDDLRERTKKALTMAHQCGDTQAHADLRQYSLTLSESLKQAA